MIKKDIVILGAGIGGLAAAYALAKQGQIATVLEKAGQIQEVGAGLQLGPNATRVLHGWGLEKQLTELADRPQRLQVNAAGGSELAQMKFDDAFLNKYAAPYVTIHRADLQNMLLQAARQFSDLEIKLDTKAMSITSDSNAVTITTEGGQQYQAPAVVGADGLWSVAREYVSPSQVQPTEHVAWRCLIAAENIAAKQLLEQVTLWLGHHVHCVSYPVRHGSLLNVVIMSRGDVGQYKFAPHQAWDLAATKEQLLTQVMVCCKAVQDLAAAGDSWRAWVLYHRPVLYRARQYIKDGVALLGDAAHPTRPHLAQGAAMAIEDAQALAINLRNKQPAQYYKALWQYAQQRSSRNAKIQLRSQLNGNIFQLNQPISAMRDLAIKIGGEKLLDLPWLYGYDAQKADSFCS